MGLDGAARSPAAVAFVQQIARQLYAAKGIGKRGKPSSASVAAVAAIVSDHVRNANPDQKRWGHRSHRPAAFSGLRVGYRPLKNAIIAMIEAGLLRHFSGHQQYVQLGGKSIPSWAMVTRSRATPALLDLAAAAGITPANHDEHFELIAEDAPTKPLKDPLELRAGSIRVGAVKYKGHPIPLDLSDPL